MFYVITAKQAQQPLVSDYSILHWGSLLGCMEWGVDGVAKVEGWANGRYFSTGYSDIVIKHY